MCGNKKKQNNKIAFNTYRFYITICHTYFLLDCKEHIQIMSNNSTINVERKNNKVNKMTKLDPYT